MVFLLLFLFVGCEEDLNYLYLAKVPEGEVVVCGNTSVTINWDMSPFSCNYCAKGIMYSLNPTPVTNNSVYSNSNSITGLKSKTIYYYRFFVSDKYENYIYGDLNSFTTLNVPASVTTYNAVNTGHFSSDTYPYHFSMSASIFGLDKVKEWGIMVSSDSDFSSYNYSAMTSANCVEGQVYTQSNWGAKYKGTQYYRAYAILTSGTYIYGTTGSIYVK